MMEKKYPVWHEILIGCMIEHICHKCFGRISMKQRRKKKGEDKEEEEEGEIYK